MLESFSQKILEDDATVAGFILVFPARATLVPIFERLFQVKLNSVDKLTAIAFDHHLVSTEV